MFPDSLFDRIFTFVMKANALSSCPYGIVKLCRNTSKGKLELTVPQKGQSHAWEYCTAHQHKSIGGLANGLQEREVDSR